ncbi:MAG TPA: protein kinase [Blastocatellia bacterium]|nr:protein kinase [Blastocatellia bacterium]
MTNEQWKKAKELFDAVAMLDRQAQADYLDRCCPDAEVQAAVLRLLENQDKLDDFLEIPAPLLLAQAGAETSITRAAGRRIGPYLLEREVGRGGMGIVYLAVRADDAYRQQVAVKLVWPGLSAGETARRFRQERQILANLEHPCIARLFDGGATAEGWQYLVMEYIKGLPITDYCDQHRLSITERLRLFREVCAAVDYAHQNLIVHRDLKPGNILVTDKGQVKLIDFGIARLLDPDSQGPACSIPGIPLLTPEYASPEQLLAQPVTTASDIYSLGVVLYELLTGHRPHQLKTRQPHEAARVITETEPALPSRVIDQITEECDQTGSAVVSRSPQLVSEARAASPEGLRRKLRGDLDNITLMALRRDPQERYRSVLQLSEDIARHLDGAPVIARKPTFGYLADRFIRKHRAAVLAGTMILLTLIVLLLLTIRQNRSEREKARLQRRELYAAQMHEAMQFWKDGEWRKMNQRLEAWLPRDGEEDLRGFEWHYLRRLVNASELTLTTKMSAPGSGVYLSDDGNTLLVTDSDLNFKTIDFRTGRELLSLPGRSAGWTMLQVFQNGIVRVQAGRRVVFQDWHTGGIEAEFTDPEGGLQLVMGLAKGEWLTISDKGTIKVREVSSGRVLRRIEGDGTRVTAYTIAKDRRKLAIVSGAGYRVTIHDLTGNQPPVRFTAAHYIGVINFNRDARRLLVQSDGLLVYDSEIGAFQGKLTHDGREIQAFFRSDDFGLIASVDSQGEVRMWDTLTLHQAGVLPCPLDVQIISFPENNKQLVTIHADRSVRLWDLATRKELAVFRGHSGDIFDAYIFPDNRKLITSSTDQTVRVWDIAAAMQPEILRGHTDHILTAAFSPDNRHVVTAGKDRTAIIHDITDGSQIVLRGHRDFVYTAVFSPDGRLLATGSNDGTAKLWGAATGREIKTIRNGTREYWDGMRSLVFTNDGQRLVAGCDDGMLRMWDVASGHLLHQFKAHEREILSVSFSPDGRLLATGGWSDGAKLWDATTWQLLAELKGHAGYVWSARFSPDGKHLATGSQDQTVKLWDVATRQLIRTLTGHNDEIFSVAFTPDGKRLATASNDKTVKIWNPATGQELLTLRDHTNEVWAAAFSPDGRTLLSAGWDKTARLWRAAGK